MYGHTYEFCTQAWSPLMAADKDCLERVQKRAVRMVSCLRAVEYEQRLEKLGLSTLFFRRGDTRPTCRWSIR